ncbi:hemerythrin domain-containing protein [Sphingomonas sp.]|uniref:hemerythrin domain-containing protein n=1 Tax=Sphingomonas sp. TaxID=28214 RepID=UPI003CC60AE9
MATQTKQRSAAGESYTGTAVAIGAGVGLVAGLLANVARKAAVQSPTMLAGEWDAALATEHKMALGIFDLLEKTTDAQAGRRSFLLMQLKHALGKHAFQEENTVYAMMRDKGIAEGADHLNHEHGYVKQYLFDLTEMSRGDARWLPKLAEFRTMIEGHMREEEQDLFPRMRGLLSDAENKHLTVQMNKEGLKLA